MHKKDYEKFAVLLRKLMPSDGLATYTTEKLLEQHIRIIAGIAGIFREDNPNFDTNKFIKAITNETKAR